MFMHVNTTYLWFTVFYCFKRLRKLHFDLMWPSPLAIMARLEAGGDIWSRQVPFTRLRPCQSHRPCPWFLQPSFCFKKRGGSDDGGSPKSMGFKTKMSNFRMILGVPHDSGNLQGNRRLGYTGIDWMVDSCWSFGFIVSLKMGGNGH